MTPLPRPKAQTRIVLKRMLCQTGRKEKGPGRKVRGTGQVWESCEEFCYVFTAHSTFFLFPGHNIPPLLAHWCTLATAELRAIVSHLSKGFTSYSLLLL